MKLMPDETRGAFRELRRDPEMLAVPARHPWIFLAVCLPEIVSIAAATLIYRFLPVYLISLVWYCLASMFLIQGIGDGELTDNTGTAVRQTTPVRFWGKVLIWSAASLLALAFPVLFALQERSKEDAEGAAMRSIPQAHVVLDSRRDAYTPSGD